MNSVEGQVVENLANGKRKVDWISGALCGRNSVDCISTASGHGLAKI